MTQQEFKDQVLNAEKVLGKKAQRTISEKDWKYIETVYTFHPSIDNVDGKRQIALLYVAGGMQVIRDMVCTAHQAKELEDDIANAKRRYEEAKQRYEDFKGGRENV